jgi:hypothetical protein
LVCGIEPTFSSTRNSCCIATTILTDTRESETPMVLELDHEPSGTGTTELWSFHLDGSEPSIITFGVRVVGFDFPLDFPFRSRCGELLRTYTRPKAPKRQCPLTRR